MNPIAICKRGAAAAMMGPEPSRPADRHRPSGPLDRFRTAVVWVVVALSVAGCGEESAAPPDLPTRETFIDTYVDLRVAALRAPLRVISLDDRARILADHGITEDDLLGFVDYHGEDVDYMRQVWNEIEEVLEAIRTQPDSVDERS